MRTCTRCGREEPRGRERFCNGCEHPLPNGPLPPPKEAEFIQKFKVELDAIRAGLVPVYVKPAATLRYKTYRLLRDLRDVSPYFEGSKYE